jgi:hypothetical protein
MIKHRTLKNTRRKIALHAQLFRAGLTLPPGPERFNYSLLRAIRRECYGLALIAFVLLAPASDAQEYFRTQFTPPPMSDQLLKDVVLFATALELRTETADPAIRTDLMAAFAGYIQSTGTRHLLDLDKWPELWQARSRYLLDTLRPPEYLTDAQQTAYTIAVNALVIRSQYPRSYFVQSRRAPVPAKAKIPKTVGEFVFYN